MITPHDDPSAPTFAEHPSSWDAAMRVAPAAWYPDAEGLAMLMVWNQRPGPLSETVDLGPALRWAGVAPGDALNVTSPIRGPWRPGHAEGEQPATVLRVAAGGAAELPLSLPPMSYQAFLFRPAA